MHMCCVAKWLYLEHDWVAEEGSYVFEPPGETHTLVVPDDCQDMVTMFTVHGALMYVDTQGNATGYDDVFTRIEKYRAHFEAVGLGADYVKTFIALSSRFWARKNRLCGRFFSRGLTSVRRCVRAVSSASGRFRQ